MTAATYEQVARHPRYGYRLIAAELRREGWCVNAKRVYRLWRREGLKVARKARKQRAKGGSANSCINRPSRHQDDVWALDFIHDSTASGGSLKMLVIEDEYTRECLLLEVSRSIKALDVVQWISEVMLIRGVPRHIRSDNGPEFIAKAIRAFLAAAGVETLYVEPGSPWENGYAESFHSRLRDELLEAEIFEDLRSAKPLAASWKNAYNHRRPHSSLGYRTPASFAASLAGPAVGAAPLPPALPAENPLPLTLITAGT